MNVKEVNKQIEVEEIIYSLVLLHQKQQLLKINGWSKTNNSIVLEHSISIWI